MPRSPCDDDLHAPVPEWIIKAFPESLAVTGWAPGPDEPDYPDLRDLSYREFR